MPYKTLLLILLWVIAFPTAHLLAQATDSLAAARHFAEGDALEKKRDYAQAMLRYRQAADGFEAVGAWQGCLNSLHRLCSRQVREAQLDSANLTADRGLRLIEAHFAGKHLKWVHLTGLKSEVCSARRHYAPAIAYLQSATEYLLKNYPEEQVFIAGNYDSWGFALSESGNLSAALRCHQQSAALLSAAEAKAANATPILRNKNLTAQVYRKMGRYDEALAQFKAARDLAERLNIPTQLAANLYSTSTALYYKGDLDAALDYLQKSADLYLKINGGSELKNHDKIYFLMAACHQAGGHDDEALRFFQKNLDLTRQKYGGDEHYDAARTLSAMSESLSSQERYQEAYQASLQALGILERVLPKPDRAKINVYESLATLYLHHRHQPDSALFFAQKIIDDLSALPDLDRYDLTRVLGYSLMSECQRETGRPDRALDFAQQALRSAARQFDSTEPSQNPGIEDFVNTNHALMALRYKAEAAFAQWATDPQTPEPALALACLNLGEKTLQQYHIQLGHQTASDFDADAAGRDFCKTALRIAAALHTRRPTPGSIARCWHWAELDKAQRLQTALRNTAAKAFAGLPDSLLQLDARLAQDVAVYENLLRTAEESGDTIAAQLWRNDSLFAARQARTDFVRRLEREYPAYFDLKYRDETPSLAEVRRNLPPQTLLLELSFGGRYDNTLYLLAVSRDTALLVARPALPDLEDKIAAFNSLLQSPASARLPKRKTLVGLGHELYQQFIKPIENQLTEKNQLFVVGESVTQYLPFETLLRDGSDRPIAALDFLVKRLHISYHYSATLLAKPAAAPLPAPAQELIAFAPVFAEGEVDIPKGWAASRDTALRAFGPGGKFLILPFSEKEVKEVAGLFNARRPGSAQVLLRKSADKAALKHALEQNSRVVHIASHSFADLRQPKFSGIACYSPDSTASSCLYVGEIYNLAAQTDLVVLSSCESGLGRLTSGEGLLGLNRAFLYAGVPNVVFSLWKVNDRASADFMEHFYRAMLSGQPYASALRTAKLKMLSNPATAAPHLWSGFLLMGQRNE